MGVVEANGPSRETGHPKGLITCRCTGGEDRGDEEGEKEGVGADRHVQEIGPAVR